MTDRRLANKAPSHAEGSSSPGASPGRAASRCCVTDADSNGNAKRPISNVLAGRIWAASIRDVEPFGARVRRAAHGHAADEHEHDGHESADADADEYGRHGLALREPTRDAERDAPSQPGSADACRPEFYGARRHAWVLSPRPSNRC